MPILLFFLWLATMAGLYLHPSSTPDHGFTLVRYLVTLFSWCIFALGIFGWGNGLRKRFFVEAPLLSSLGIGISIWVILGFIGGTLGLTLFAPWMILILLGLGLFFLPRISLPTDKFTKTELFLFAAIFIVVATRFLAASQPESHGDPLLYHLVGPRQWALAGKVIVNPEVPNPILATFWEYLYLWPQLLFYRPAILGSGLIESQLFSQWTHLLLGWGGTLAMMYVFLGKFTLTRTQKISILFCCAFVASVQWTASVAKNDWGVMLWEMTAILLLGTGQKKIRYVWIAGLCLGLAQGAKPNAIFFLPLALAYAGYHYRAGIIYLLPGYLLAMGALLGRNYFLTQNPFYPIMHNFFPSPYMSDSWVEHFSTYQPGATAIGGLGRWLARILQILKESPWIAAFILIPFFWRSGTALQKCLAVTSAVCLLFFIFGMGSHTELRHLGLCLPFMIAFTLAWIVPQLPPRISAYFWIIIIPCLALSHIPLHLWWRTQALRFGHQAILSHTAGEAKAWIRAQPLSTKEKVALIADNEAYYLTDWPLVILSEYTPLDRLTRLATSLPEFCQGLSGFPAIRYLLDARPQMGITQKYQKNALQLRAAEVFSHDAIVYDRLLLCPLVSGKLHK